jgi:hypothetical protein
LQFSYDGEYRTLLSGLATPYLQFAKIWDNTEKLDVLLFVLGEASTRKWSGGVTTVRSSTGATLTKQGVIVGTTIAFVAGTPGTVAPTITDSGNGFVDAGFEAGDSLHVSGSTANNRIFTIGSVAAGTLTLIMSDTLVSEAAGPSITLHTGEPTWASSRFLTTGTRKFVHNSLEYLYTGGEATRTLTGVEAVTGVSLGTCTITIASPGVITRVAHGLAVGDPVRFTTTGALPTGLTASTTYYVISAGLTADEFQVSATSGGAAVNTSGSQSGVHTLTDRSMPSVTVGDIVWQTVITLANPGAINSNFKQDLIGVQLNQLILASTKSQEIYISADDDYTNFTLTSPRAPGDPAKLTMDNYCTCIVPVDTLDQTDNSLIFGGGTSEFFKMKYQLSEDLTGELVRMVKLKTAASSGIISKDAIVAIKNAAAYISREPSFDTLGSVESMDGPQNVPISDSIKNDFDEYDFTDAHAKYWKRSVYIAVPREGLILIYDLQRRLWQPPQTIAIGRLAVIEDWLYGHSSVTNETYKLFVGTNDNGVFIPQVARFAYNNAGDRSRIKNVSEYWTDGYITAGGELTMYMNLGFEGYLGIKSMSILGSDSDIVVPQSGSMLGDEPLGVLPLGGATSGPLSGFAGANAQMLRFYQIDTMDLVDYIEHYIEYRMNSLDGQFAIVAHGSNQYDAGTAPITHKK